MEYPRAGAHYPRSTAEFLAWSGTDEDCLDYLDWLRWPGGFIAPSCGHAGGWRLGDGRPECGGCGQRPSVTAGTVFDRMDTPLAVWFHACWLFATAKDGSPPSTFGGHWRSARIRQHGECCTGCGRSGPPGRGQLSGSVEVDETFIGGGGGRAARRRSAREEGAYRHCGGGARAEGDRPVPDGRADCISQSYIMLSYASHTSFAVLCHVKQAALLSPLARKFLRRSESLRTSDNLFASDSAE